MTAASLRLGSMFALLTCVGTASCFAQCGRWIERAPLTVPRHGMALGASNGRLYCALGGYPTTSALESYNDQTNTWTRLANASIAVETRGAFINGKLYCVGGNQGGFCTSTFQSFDPATGSWAFLPSMPTARCHVCIVALNGKLYAIGGTNTSGTTSYTTVEIYDPATNAWSAGIPMPNGRVYAGAAVVDGKIYVVGGANANVVQSTALVFNPATNSWSTTASMSVARHFPAVAEYNGELYVAGGSDPSQATLSSVESYSPATGAWSPRPPMQHPRSAAALEVLHGVLYAVGGFSPPGDVTSVEAFTPCPTGCVADVDDGRGTGIPDGGVTIDDLLYFLRRFEEGC